MISIINKIMNTFNKKQSALSPYELFSIRLLSQLLEKNGNMNVLVSPARIMSILFFLSHFTDNDTKKQIGKLLSITDDDAINYLTKESLLPSDNYESWASEEYTVAAQYACLKEKQRFGGGRCRSDWLSPKPLSDGPLLRWRVLHLY